MMEFSKRTRQQNIEAFKKETFDLAIIGGGITGAGVARDAASRGMKVALIEKNDFASGTSSRSSKLIHGGIRYLENLEFHLVYEALSERSLLFEIAPHLVHPLRFLFPVYKESRVGMFKLGMGMWLYDILSAFESPELHERLSTGQSIDRMPILKSDDLLGSFVYSDAYMDDDRLVLETLRSANELGAKSANYVEAMGADFEGDKIKRVACRDTEGDQEFYLNAKHFVSTVGPWTDRLAERMLSPWKPVMRPSKGIHLTLSRDRLPLDCAVVMGSGKDNRIVFGIPRHEMVIIGTTDTDFVDDPENVNSTVEDVDYLLSIVAEYFPGAKLKKEDIIASYAGVRPLVHDGSATESSTSREHVILSDLRNVTLVAGGKYTTYRKMAEQTIEAALSQYSIEDQSRFQHNNTKCAINSKINLDRYSHALSNYKEVGKQFELSDLLAQRLVQRHGEEAFEMDLETHRGSENSKDRFWQIETNHAIDTTMCYHLRDFYLRRTPLFLSEPDHGISKLKLISQVFQDRLGWSDVHLSEEKELLKRHFVEELGWKSSLESLNF